MTSSRRIPLTLSLFLIACGGAGDSSPTTPAAASPAPAAEHHDDHGDLPPALVAFHDALRPLWHDETPERQAKTCAQVNELESRATPLESAEVPADRQEKWKIEVTGLKAALMELSNACAGNADFAASFTRVHDSFHHLVEIAGGKHREDHH